LLLFFFSLELFILELNESKVYLTTLKSEKKWIARLFQTPFRLYINSAEAKQNKTPPFFLM